MSVPFLDIEIVDVGDFEFAAAGGFEAADFFEDRGVVEIDPDDRETGLGRFRFLLDAHDVSTADLGDAEALGVMHFFQQDFCAVFLAVEAFHGVVDVRLNDVVAQDDTNWLAAGEDIRPGQGPRRFRLRLPDTCSSDV